MKGFEDPWRVLGVATHAPVHHAKAAYRAKVRRCHPDRGGDPTEFLRVQAAWEQIAAAVPSLVQPAASHASTPSSTDAASSDVIPVPSSPSQGVSGAKLWVSRGPRRMIGQIRLVPGPQWLLVKAMAIAATLVWVAVGVAVGALVAELHRWSWSWIMWVGLWVAVAAWSGIRIWAGGSGLSLAAAATLALISFWAGLPTATVLVVVGWLVIGLGFPLAGTLLRRPLCSAEECLGPPVWNIPQWEHRGTAAEVEQLTQIPAVRIMHSTPLVRHLVVCGARVAAIGVDPGWACSTWALTRIWPLQTLSEPDGLNQIADWLLADSDGITVDRRVLAEVFSAKHFKSSSPSI